MTFTTQVIRTSETEEDLKLRPLASWPGWVPQLPRPGPGFGEGAAAL